METVIKQARSGTDASNLQEVIDASVSAKQATLGGQNQYETPANMAMFFNGLLPGIPNVVFDPQCASGQLLNGMPYWAKRLGFEIDSRFEDVNDGVQRVIANCVDAWEVLGDLYPELEFQAQVANPPFGIRWKTPSGSADSTEYTWARIMEKASPFGYGYFIANYKTIERLKLHEHPRVYLYQRFPAGVWKNTTVEVGCLHWDVAPHPERKSLVYTTLDLAEHAESLAQIKAFYKAHPRGPGSVDAYVIADALRKVSEVVKEEKRKHPAYNVFLDKNGMLRTYLSTRFITKRKITREEILRLAKVDNQHALTLTVDRESRKLLAELINAGIYTIQPEARKAIDSALAEVASLSCPIMPVTDFETVAYADEEDHLECSADLLNEDGEIIFTAGKKYELRTSSYSFSQEFEREKPHYNEETNQMYTVKHKCRLSGTDRFVMLVDDQENGHRFMDRPEPDNKFDHDEHTLWQHFKKPEVKTVSEADPAMIAHNKTILATCEMFAGFTFYPGQLEYLSRVAAKDYGIIAADVGCGKTVMAISLIQIKAPKRALIIAPQGTMRGSEVDDDDEEEVEHQASQWVEELQKFGPGLPIFQLFSLEDYRRILAANKGRLPEGVYISYYEAFFSNGARETAAKDWNDERLAIEIGKLIGRQCTLPEPTEDCINPARFWCESVGKEKHGIRCIMQPCMATLIGDHFDFVALDEGHRCFPYETLVDTDQGKLPIGQIVDQKLNVNVLSCNLNSKVTQWKNVTGHFNNKSDKNLVRITHEHGTLICTEDHQIWTSEGFKEAKAIRPGESLQALLKDVLHTEARGENFSVLQSQLLGGREQLQPREDSIGEGKEKAPNIIGAGMCSMREAIHVPQGEGENEPEVLRAKMRHQALVTTPPDRGRQAGTRPVSWKEPERLPAAGIVHPNDASQSNAVGEEQAQGKSDAFRAHVLSPRREREVDQAASPAGERIGAGDGVCNLDRTSNGAVQIASPLIQGGHSEPGTTGCNRSGRGLSQASQMEVLGQEENGGVVCSRVVGVEVLEPGDRQRLTSHGAQGERVYCIEVEGNHNFYADGVLVANCVNLGANVSQMLIRLQPRYRYVFTATPIPNVVANLFSLMGWVCVPGWYKGEVRNAAWPYAREEIGRFIDTFQSEERDYTQEDIDEANAKKSKSKWTRKKCIKVSPIISAPARLLKILKPSMAFISKPMCSPAYVEPKIVDVRVPMGAQQMALYAHFMNRGNIDAKNPLVRARKQITYLRNITADPMGFTHGGPKVTSNFNPKTVAILELARDIIVKGDQFVIVCARKGQTDTLHAALRDAGLLCSRIDSTISAEQHSYQSNQFKSHKTQALLMGIKCANSYSFHECPYMIIGSLEYSWGSLAQARGRVDRVNSKRPATIYCVLHKHSLEELMFDVVATKQDSATICLQGQRVPREYKPVDMAEVLATSITNFTKDGAVEETQCEQQWPKLRASFNY